MNKKHVLIVGFLNLFFSCSSTNLVRINNFYKEKYPEINHYKYLKTLEKFRSKSIAKYSKSAQLRKNKSALIEIIRFPNGNFDNPEYESYFSAAMNGTSIFSYDLRSKKINEIENRDYSDWRTIDTFLKMVEEKNVEKIKNMYNNPKNTISEAGTVYLSILDRDYNVVEGIKFTEFYVPPAGASKTNR